MSKGGEEARPFKQLLHWTNSGYLSGLPEFAITPEAMGSYLGPSQTEYPSDCLCALGSRLDLNDWHYQGRLPTLVEKIAEDSADWVLELLKVLRLDPNHRATHEYAYMEIATQAHSETWKPEGLGLRLQNYPHMKIKDGERS